MRAPARSSRRRPCRTRSFSVREYVQGAGEVRARCAPQWSSTADATVSNWPTVRYRRPAPSPPRRRSSESLYHGGGAHSGAGYQHLGSAESPASAQAVRHRGLRAGPARSPCPQADVARLLMPPAPSQVLGAETSPHSSRMSAAPKATASSVAPVVIRRAAAAVDTHHYVSQPASATRPVSGYALLSPRWVSSAHRGLSGSREPPFTWLRPLSAVEHAVGALPPTRRAGGSSHGHDRAVRFNYPPSFWPPIRGW